MGAHALLSPSAASRWLNCTAAPLLEAGAKDDARSYTEEGTLAHTLAARALREAHGLTAPEEERGEEDGIIARLYDTLHDGEMDEAVATYVNAVGERMEAARGLLSPDARLYVEQRLDLTRWLPEGFGRADAVIVADGTMEVLDFKYGKGVKVSAWRNPQMMIYGLGALERFADYYDIDRVCLTVVQPRIGNISEFVITSDDLLRWGAETLGPRAEEAYFGRGKAEPGEWCRFCRVRSTCRALALQSLQASATLPGTLTEEELARDVLPRLPMVRAWAAAVEEKALGAALSGSKLPGWKLVRGRGTRRITCPEEAAQALSEAGMAESEIWRPRELRGVTDMEKALGKKRFAELLGPYVEKSEGKPGLAPDDDPRPALDTVADDFGTIS